MKRYRWPGNVRELENLVRRLVALYTDRNIGAPIIESELREIAPEAKPAGEEDDSKLNAVVERYLTKHFAEFGGRLPPIGLYDRVLREVERPLISLCLGATRGNQIKAAELLGLNRNTLRKKIRDLDIPVLRGLK